MILTICSEHQAQKLAKSATKNTSIISITCPEDGYVDFGDNKYIVSVFRMRFNDIDHDKIPEIPPPELHNFYGLKDFVDRLCCEELIIHCHAGISRSAAVAAAIDEYLHLGYHIFDDERYHPNRLVYKYACIELGMIVNRETEDYYKGVFK